MTNQIEAGNEQAIEAMKLILGRSDIIHRCRKVALEEMMRALLNPWIHISLTDEMKKEMIEAIYEPRRNRRS